MSGLVSSRVERKHDFIKEETNMEKPENVYSNDDIIKDCTCMSDNKKWKLYLQVCIQVNVSKPDMVQSGAGLSMACCTVTELHSRAEDPDSVIRRTTPLLLESTYAISHYSKEGAKVTKIKEQDMNWAKKDQTRKKNLGKSRVRYMKFNLSLSSH